jgi:hypothetical protein
MIPHSKGGDSKEGITRGVDSRRRGSMSTLESCLPQKEAVPHRQLKEDGNEG